jgi:hypothetical protein
LLLGLLDGCTMPADLVAPAEGEADALEGMQQRSMLQLERLALAQEEAAPAGVVALIHHKLLPSLTQRMHIFIVFHWMGMCGAAMTGAVLYVCCTC